MLLPPRPSLLPARGEAHGKAHELDGKGSERDRFLVLTTPCGIGVLSGKARKLRVEYPGSIYHVMNRGDRREALFKNAKDCEWFIESPGEICVRSDWQAHALCPMGGLCEQSSLPVAQRNVEVKPHE